MKPMQGHAKNSKIIKSNIRIATWNCARGMNDNDNALSYTKKHLIQSLNCIAVGITECQNSFKIRNYSTIHSKAHTMVQSKINASICFL
jgi:hypothetical protein